MLNLTFTTLFFLNDLADVQSLNQHKVVNIDILIVVVYLQIKQELRRSDSFPGGAVNLQPVVFVPL